MTDQELATLIAYRVHELRSAVENAQLAGLAVDVPDVICLYLCRPGPIGKPVGEALKTAEHST